MASALIGSLRVNLGIDTAAFTDGLKQANTRLSSFAAMAKRAIVPAAAAAAAAIGGIAVAVRGAINEADDMGKMAQKFGVPIETLSRLRFAADLSDVSVDTLGASLGRLSRNMAEAAGGSKSAAAAFASAGIGIKNADGSLRAADDVLADIADRFASMPDGAAKTAMAMALMGRGGATMIPMLNGGAQALRDMGEEAERLGLVISSETSKAAEEFNDNLTRLSAIARGAAMQLAAYLAPALAEVTAAAYSLASGLVSVKDVAAEVFDRMVQLAQSAAADLRGVAYAIQSAFVSAFGAILSAAATTFEFIGGAVGRNLGEGARALADEAEAAAAEFGAAAKTEFDNAAWLFADAHRSLESLKTPAKSAAAAVSGLGDAFDDAAGGGGKGKGGGAKKLSEEVRALQSALEDLNREATQIFAETRTPQEKFSEQMLALNGHLNAGRISMDTYTRAVIQAQEELEKVGDTGTDAFRNLADDAGDMVADLVQGTTTIKEAFSRMLAQIGGDLISSGITDALKGVFGGGAGGGGIFAGIGKAIGIPGFANGTNFAPGGLAMVGERGPELVSLPRGARVTPNHQLKAQRVEVDVTLHGDIDARIAQGSGKVFRREGPKLVNQSVRAVQEGNAASARFLNG